MSCHIWSFTVCCVVSEFSGAPVAQWVKPWPTDLAAAGSNPAWCGIFSVLNRIPNRTQPFIITYHTAFYYHLPSSWYEFDCNTFEKNVKSQVILPSISEFSLWHSLDKIFFKILQKKSFFFFDCFFGTYFKALQAINATSSKIHSLVALHIISADFLEYWIDRHIFRKQCRSRSDCTLWIRVCTFCN